MPELLQHTAVDQDVLRALPQPPAGISVGTWDVAAMESVGRMPSVGFDGVWGSGRGAGPGACILASVVGRSARIGAGSLVAHCDIGHVTTVGPGRYRPRRKPAQF